MSRSVVLVGLLSLSMMTGCSSRAGVSENHGHNGPHGGLVFDWGKDLHLEFLAEHSQNRVVVHVLAADGKPAPIEARSLLLSLKRPSAAVTLRAQPLDSDPPGKSSRFVGTHPAIKPGRRFAGTVKGQLNGVALSGDFDQQYPGKCDCR